jgi:hypothetical protein
MALHALDDIEDAIEATKSFLLPFSWRRWLRLAVVVLFMGGLSGSVPNNTGTVGDFGGTGGGGGTGGAPFGPSGMPELPGGFAGMEPLVLAGIVIAVLGSLWLVFGIVGAVMEFVFVESLRSDEVHVRRYARRHVGRGVRLFGFRVVLGVLALLVLGAAAALVAFGIVGGSLASWGPGQFVGAFLFLLPFLLVIFVLYALVNGFTTTMVVPTMLNTDRRVLAAWRRFWPTLRGNLKEYAMYSVMVVALHLATGIIVGIGTLIVLLVLAIPFGIAGFGTFLAAGGSLSLPVVIVLGVLGALFLLAFLLLTALVRVPIKAFFRFYALLVLGDTDRDLDLIPDLRAEIRRDDRHRRDQPPTGY